MRAFEEIRKCKQFQKNKSGKDGGNGWVTINGQTFFIVYSNGGGWDHVSVSMRNRCPTWEEMCQIKEIFFNDDECCVEYHPAKKNYVNLHPYCLHIWKPQNADLQIPPKIYV